jgi:uncharacterized repeat protein (TIGR01451 family)
MEKSWQKIGFISVLLLGAVVGFMLLHTQSSAQAEASPILSNSLAAAREPLLLPAVQISIDEVVASGFIQPTQVTHAGDGSRRLFIVEQGGKIWIVKNGSVLPTPFLDVTSLVICCGERGLLGLAFHPHYTANGYFYITYSRAGDGTTVIARYHVSSTDPDRADPTSAMVLLTIAQPYPNHKGGQLRFNPQNGYLYIGTGDGGSAGDPQNNAQNINSLLGKMLRIDVDRGTPYAIPVGNPYIGKAGLDEIWDIGLRNPWRWSFDRQTGDLYIGDVGQNLWEEIDYQAAGTPGRLNYGWRCMEGNHAFSFTPSCSTLQLIGPITEYSHTVGSCVIGGFVYRGLAYPSLVGRYFYADYIVGKIWSLYKIGTNPTTWSAPELQLNTGLNISAFGEDEDGELYVVDYGGGTIRHLVDVNSPTPNLSTSKKQASTPSADPLEVVTYSLHLNNTGLLVNRPVMITDTIPAGLSYVPGSLHASQGTWSDLLDPILAWQGNLNASQHITITYQVTVTGAVTGSLVNKAILSFPPSQPMSLMAALSVPRSVLTTTVQDFFIPGTQPMNLNVEIKPSADCDTCHSQPIYDRWRGSMMSQAGRDPLMWSALYVANIDAPNAGEYCLRCHTSTGWLQGRSHPADGSALQASDIVNGVPCALCHRMVDPFASATDEAVAIDQAIRLGLTDPLPAGLTGSAAMIIDPNDNRRGPFSFGLSLPYHTAYRSDFLGQSGNAITRARLCGTCHNVYNPVLSWDAVRGQFWPNTVNAHAPSFNSGQLFPVETTFDEWRNSAFAQGGVFAPQFAGSKPDGVVETCQDCHMPRTIGKAADDAFNPVLRDCQTTGCLPEHTFVGGNTWVPQLLKNFTWRLNAISDSSYLNDTSSQAQLMLQNAASLTVTLTTSNTVRLATVRLTNHTGHKLPTGYAEGRQMWLNLKAYDANDQMIFESGAYNPLTGQLSRDAASKVYEVQQGITPELASILKLSAGGTFHFVLNNTVIKDNRIPPQGYTQAAFDQPGLRPVGASYVDGQYWDQTRYTLPLTTERVVVTLYYQTSSKEYIDFLQKHGGVDGLALGGLWSGLKSPPQVMTQAWTPRFDVCLPFIFR